MYQVIKRKNQYNFIINEKILASSNDKEKLFNTLIRGANQFINIKFKQKFMILSGVYIYKDKHNIVDSFNISAEEKNFKTQIIFKIKIVDYKICYYKTQINYYELNQNVVNTKLYITSSGEYKFKKRLSYKMLKNNLYNSSKHREFNNNTVIYLKQTKNNGMDIVQRGKNISDDHKYKICLAKIVSKFLPKNKILLYEKNLESYEESASVLYEELINRKYKKVYYLIDKNKSMQNKNNLIYKGSFKNYLYFFTARTFLGTEFIDHVIDTRVKNKCVEKYIAKRKYNFVFLQHGVMYMISLSSGARNFFKKGEVIGGKSKIVVSSKLEADHFINSGGYNINDLYITGLPKFDKNTRYKNADKITIMLTWRPWEYNEARLNPKETSYYKSMMEIYNAIPKELKNKTVLLPHPLFLKASKDYELFEDIKSYDEVLKSTNLLITDYSSISIDAFSRGSNVIFWWKNLNECMNKYSGDLIFKNNLYGDVCKTKNELVESIEKLYQKNQPKNYKIEYNKIVEFDDLKNTDRLIEQLKKDKYI